MLAPLFISIPEAALCLGVGRTSIYGYHEAGDLHIVHQGRRAVVALSEVVSLAARLAEEAGVPTESLEGLRELSEVK